MVDTIDLDKAFKDTNVVILNDEEIIESKEELGKGTFGTVRKGLFGDKEVAIKELIFKSDEFTPDEIVRDIQNELKAFSIVGKLHPAIVKFYGVLKQKERICFVFELIKGKDLTHVYKNMSDKEKLRVVVDICDVLVTLHKNKLIHRDIKPNNVMIENETGKIRIIDFGTVKIAKNETTFTVNQKGTENYMSPELIEIIELDGDDDNDTCHFSVSGKVDVWAVGCLISEIFSGYIPWVNQIGKNSLGLRRLLKTKKPFPIPNEITNQNVINIIKSATEINIEKRCNMEELKELALKALEAI